MLKSEPVDRVLVFTRTKHGADKVVRGLQKSGFAAEAIHGNKSQNQRERVLADFRNGTLRMLIATDIAARGIDVDGVSHVINYDLPNMPESYVHRIGRTARAGAEGIAISFCDYEEAPFLRDIERHDPHVDPLDRPAHRPAAGPSAGRSIMPATAMAGGRIVTAASSAAIMAARRRPPAATITATAPKPATAIKAATEPEWPPGRPPGPMHSVGGAKRHRKCYIPAAPARAAP